MMKIYKVLARGLRKNQTSAEDILWSFLRDRKTGYKYLRQHPIKFTIDGKIKFFIADFFCARRKLIIEVDGKIHDNRIEYDRRREKICLLRKYRTIRIKNELIFNSIQEVIAKINKQ